MAGTRLGGLKARDKNLEKDPDFYRKIGMVGGRNGHTGGFAADRERARWAGRLGGLKSRRGKKVVLRNDTTGEITEFTEVK